MGSRRGNMRGAFENILKKFSPNLTPANDERLSCAGTHF